MLCISKDQYQASTMYIGCNSGHIFHHSSACGLGKGTPSVKTSQTFVCFRSYP